MRSNTFIARLQRILLVAGLWLVSAQVLAATADARFGIGAGYRFADDVAVEQSGNATIDDAKAVSLTLEWPDSRSTWWQLYASQWHSDWHTPQRERYAFSQSSLQIGGLKEVDMQGWAAYLGAGIGLARLQMQERGGDTRTRPAYSLFGGLRYALTPMLDLRLEARWLGVVFSSETTMYCADEGCQLQFDAGSWSQGEVGTSLQIHF